MLAKHRLNRVIWTANACTLALLAGLSSAGKAVAQQQDLLEWPCDVVPVGTDIESDRGPVVSGISLQPHGQLLAIVGDDSLVRLSDRDTGKQLFVLEGHHEWVRCVQFSVDGQYLFTAGNDRRILKWDTKTGEMVGEVTFAPFAVYAMQVNPRNGKLAIAGFSSDILVFDPEQPALKTVIEGSCADIRVVRFSADGKQLAAAGRDGWVRIWDLDAPLTIDLATQTLSLGDEVARFPIDPFPKKQLLSSTKGLAWLLTKYCKVRHSNLVRKSKNLSCFTARPSTELLARWFTPSCVSTSN